MTCEQIRDQIDQSMMDGAEMSVEIRTHVDGCSSGEVFLFELYL